MPKELVYFPSWTAGRKGYADRVRQVFQEYLHAKDLRLTDQRAAILNELLSAERHLSLDDLYQSVRGRGIGKVTVFRTLKMLEDSGLVDKIQTSQGRMRYEMKLERPHHDHLVCVLCGRITEVQWPAIEKIQERDCRKMGFEILWHRHEVFGKCRDCRGV